MAVGLRKREGGSSASYTVLKGSVRARNYGPMYTIGYKNKEDASPDGALPYQGGNFPVYPRYYIEPQKFEDVWNICYIAIQQGCGRYTEPQKFEDVWKICHTAIQQGCGRHIEPQKFENV